MERGNRWLGLDKPHGVFLAAVIPASTADLTQFTSEAGHDSDERMDDWPGAEADGS